MSVEVSPSPALAELSHTTSQSSASGLEAPLSPSALPELAILPKPLAADKLLVGQFVSSASKHNSPGLEDRDYDDVGVRWYKDVVLVDSKTGRFTDSLGGILYIQEPGPGTEVGTIEAREMRVRLLKDENKSLRKVLKEEETRQWVMEQAQKGDVGFVTAVREVTNASYKHAKLVDRGAGNWEVVREVGGEARNGKRRDSGLDVETGSKVDVVGVVVRKVVIEGDKVELGEELGTDFWE